MIQTYAARPGAHQARARAIYTELRENIIENVHKVCSRIRVGLYNNNTFTGIRAYWICMGTVRRPIRGGAKKVRISCTPWLSSLKRAPTLVTLSQDGRHW
jgi:hypothetical protein